MESPGFEKYPPEGFAQIEDSDETASDTDDVFHVSTVFGSYREYIAFLQEQNKNFEWIHKFFTKETKTPTSHGLMLDSIDGKLIRRKVNRKSLQSRPKGVSSRIIMLSHGDVWNIDRDALDDISYALDLDPVFLWRHLDHDFSHIQNPYTTRRKVHRGGSIAQQPLSSISETHSLEIICDRYNSERLSALIIKDSGPVSFTTVLLLGGVSGVRYQPHFGFEGTYTMHLLSKGKGKTAIGTTYQHYKSMLRSWTSERVLAADRNPIQFIYPYIHLLLYQHGQEIAKSRLRILDMTDPSLAKFWDTHLHAEEAELFSRSVTAENLAMSLASFERFTSLHSDACCADTPKITSDFKKLLQETTRLENTMRDRVNRRAAILSLEESRKSIEMADSVRTLTQLAFVFVPLSFGTSLFGTNVRELGSGTVPLWACVLTMLLVSAATGTLWWWSTRGLTRYFGELGERVAVLALFALRAPGYAALLGVYAVCHGSKDTNRRLHDLGLTPVLREGRRTFTVPEGAFRRPDGEVDAWKRFWLERLRGVSLFTRRDGWWEDYFWRRWAERWKSGVAGREGVGERGKGGEDV